LDPGHYNWEELQNILAARLAGIAVEEQHERHGEPKRNIAIELNPL
jgi:hypothetical protein